MISRLSHRGIRQSLYGPGWSAASFWVIFLAFIIKLLRARQKEEVLLEEDDEDF